MKLGISRTRIVTAAAMLLCFLANAVVLRQRKYGLFATIMACPTSTPRNWGLCFSVTDMR